ncbi:MAG: 7-cyano-7-deazaguanine synthase [Phycisphaerae bacterium]|nr:7-cyano-7-deazaguanine synthase [Phycisphaerae bacterium]
MDTAVILASGGVNSLVTAALAAKEYSLAMMHVAYGQRTAERELSCFRQLCKHLGPCEQIVVPLTHVEAVGGSARVDRKLAVEDARTLGDRPANTYMPGLIPAMLGLAFHWASAIGARHVFIGSSESDGPPVENTPVLFPDHRREVYHLYNQLMEMIAKKECKVQLQTPLITMTRGEVIRLGQHLDVPFEASWSCERTVDVPCSSCYGCVSRAQGFVDAAVTDPIMIRED